MSSGQSVSIKSIYKDDDTYFGIKTALLPNGGKISIYGSIITQQGVKVHIVPDPGVIPLTWTSRVETCTREVQCKKLEGRYERITHGGSSPSSDGYRSGSDMRWENVFVNETYTVSLTYNVLIMTSNEGEEVVFSPDMPNPSSLSVWTGYGRDTSFTMNNVLPMVPPMPSERAVTLEEKLQYYYDSAMLYFKLA